MYNISKLKNGILSKILTLIIKIFFTYFKFEGERLILWHVDFLRISQKIFSSISGKENHDTFQYNEREKIWKKK